MTITVETTKGMRIALVADSVQQAMRDAKPFIQKGDAIKSITTPAQKPVN